MNEIAAEQEHHPVHRRAAHARRRRRGRRRDRRRQHAQAGAGARRDPVHRRDHARRVPQVHREGRRARAPLPDGHGRAALGGRDGRDPQGPAQEVRGPPPRRDSPTTTLEAAVEAVGALHHRPVPARQGDRRDRRGRRARASSPRRRRRRKSARLKRELEGVEHGEGSGGRAIRTSSARRRCRDKERELQGEIRRVQEDWEKHRQSHRPVLGEPEIAFIVSRWTGIPRDAAAGSRDHAPAAHGRGAAPVGRRPGRGDQGAVARHPPEPRGTQGSRPADRLVHLPRPDGRRQDRAGALRWRTSCSATRAR